MQTLKKTIIFFIVYEALRFYKVYPRIILKSRTHGLSSQGAEIFSSCM